MQKFCAVSLINEQESSRRITTRRCAVYADGLPRHAVLVLASQHNEFNLIQRTTTFPEIAACCRQLLFSLFAEGMEDDGTNNPMVPYYNSTQYKLYKHECLSFLVSSQVVRSKCTLTYHTLLYSGTFSCGANFHVFCFVLLHFYV